MAESFYDSVRSILFEVKVVARIIVSPQTPTLRECSPCQLGQLVTRVYHNIYHMLGCFEDGMICGRDPEHSVLLTDVLIRQNVVYRVLMAQLCSAMHLYKRMLTS